MARKRWQRVRQSVTNSMELTLPHKHSVEFGDWLSMAWQDTDGLLEASDATEVWLYECQETFPV